MSALISVTGVFVFIATVVLGAHGLLFDGPCDISPAYHHGGTADNPDFTTTIHAHHGCMNGTMRWDYPKGHVEIIFKNEHAQRMSVCLRDSLNGDIFTFTDGSSGTSLALPALTDKEPWVCTAPSIARDIVLKVDAPVVNYYMGTVLYKLEATAR